MEIKRTRQCDNCPWRVDADLQTIPEYVESWHRQLRRTIAQEASLRMTHVMACHKHREDVVCVGWLVNQLGPGNNIPLRLAMRNADLGGKQLEVFGEQYDTFEQTLPENRNTA